MADVLAQLRKKMAIGFLGGSDWSKIADQLEINSGNVADKFDYGFAENGLIAYKMGKELPSQSFIKFVGETEYKKLVNFILHYLADIDVPIKRIQERNEFEAYDKIHQIRTKFVQKLKENFPEYDLTYSIGGQISFDIFPRGWDKTYALKHVEDEGFEEIHFFGDKTYLGGNDYEIYTDSRTIGHSVKNPDDTIRQLREIFLS
ncbi:Phosphomannomutase [Tulasnella sp. 425]|nr:Phosphomannomutase [Tulasnella sp. 425]